MDLNLTSQELQFRDEVRAWFSANVPKDWVKRRNAEESMQARFDYLRQWQRTMFDAGWAGVSWPKQYGGRGATLMEQVIFIEEMARAEAPPMANVLGLGLIGPTIIAYGNDAQKTRFLQKILSAEEIWCQGFSEPNAGSDLAAASTEAKRDGDHFIINGHKCWNSYAWAADWCELVVRTDPDQHKGLTVLLVGMKAPGVEVRGLKQMSGESEFCEIFFRDVRVPAENVVGKVNDGWRVAMGTLMHERGTFGAALQVNYRRNFNRLVEIARERKLTGDPLVRQKLAQMYAEIEVMRCNQMRAFSRINETGVPGPEGSIQKIFWSELNQRFQQIAMEVLGPYAQLAHGSADAFDQGQWAYNYLRARGNTIEAGTSEIQRNIIGHFVLGLPKSY
ncbi:MAG: acyl-CoA dehydrogenase family protein [Acidobacteriia bacterium]|nr:acyl-CoA dehydrogenase family protein [Terriglobia bacterium]